MRCPPTFFAFVFVASMIRPTPAAGQPAPDQMCGDGTTFTVELPAVGATVGADSVTLPNGCRIYALLVSGYARNKNFDELTFYKLAKFVMESDGYVHWAWWNNLLKEYMEGPLHRDTFTRPLTGEVLSSSPGGLNGVHASGFVPPNVVDVVPKAIPEEDYQFQADAHRMLIAIRQHNPTAIIVVAGHSMGGDSVARLGANVTVAIDLLAPIDPVGNRSVPVGIATDRTYNWTRWRATQEVFRGFRQADCIRNPSVPALCRDFDSRVFFTEYRCTTVGPYLDSPPLVPTRAPGVCPGPIAHAGTRRRFGPNVRRLYHRWQKEAVFPFDYPADERFGHGAPLNALVDVTGPFNLQRPVLENVVGERDRDKTCSVGLDPRDTERLCNDGDGHGEIVGFRSPTPGQPNVGPLSDNTPVAPLALRLRNWPPVSAAGNRRQQLMQMVDADDSWGHRPLDPDLCMVSDDMVLVVRALVDALGPPPPPDDTTGPVTTASLDPDANANGWHNDQVSITLRAAEEMAGSGVAGMEWALTGAHIASETVMEDTSEVLLSAEGVTRATFFARDRAGNMGATSTLDVRIDTTPPEVAATTDVIANAEGWSTTDVIVSFTAADALSGLATVSDPVLVTAEGASQEITGSATDLADNESTATAVVSIDKTPPLLSVVLSSAANANGWHRSDVRVTFIAADALSGVASITAPVLVTTEGVHEVSGVATDRAGNATTMTAVVKLDKTPPEAFLQFDPVHRDVALFGTDSLSGTGPDPIAPAGVTPGAKTAGWSPSSRSAVTRIHVVEDGAGNSLVIRVAVRRSGSTVDAAIRTLAYNGGVAIAPKNATSFSWDARNLHQYMEGNEKRTPAGKSVRPYRVFGQFKHKRGTTVLRFQVPLPKRTYRIAGLALLKLVTSNGRLKVERP